MSITSYKDLDVWKKAVDLVTETYSCLRKFPPEEMYGLASQIRRAAVSVPANMAEGWGKQTTRSFLMSLRISRGSLLELETELQIAFNLKYLDKTDFETLIDKITEISKMLNVLIQKLETKNRNANA